QQPLAQTQQPLAWDAPLAPNAGRLRLTAGAVVRHSLQAALHLSAPEAYQVQRPARLPTPPTIRQSGSGDEPWSTDSWQRYRSHCLAIPPGSIGDAGCAAVQPVLAATVAACRPP